MPAILLQVNVSAGGMPKLPLTSARVMFTGVEGDRQKNLEYHSGRDRAVCLYSEELYERFRAEGIDIYPGAIGENFTTRGLDLQSLQPGDRLAVGDCVIAISKVRVPCKQLNIWHPEFHKKIEGRSGWLARVLKEGTVRPGDSILHLPVQAAT
ncbi:MAG TPA: MOSC domain-containing protein [Tepidisphaeraceae bacterium]|jgi:MOSC domain-containing protein YiiM|nr:MOSC domain-containing protein [Tepidisphaeraceae bacterium]